MNKKGDLVNPIIVAFTVFVVGMILMDVLSLIELSEKQQELREKCIKYLDHKQKMPGYFNAELEYDCFEKKDDEGRTVMMPMFIPMIR